MLASQSYCGSLSRDKVKRRITWLKRSVGGTENVHHFPVWCVKHKVRIGAVAHGIIQRGMNSRYALKHLAWIIVEVPSDFEWSLKESLYNMTQKFLSEQSESARNIFEREVLRLDPLEARPNGLLSYLMRQKLATPQ